MIRNKHQAAPAPSSQRSRKGAWAALAVLGILLLAACASPGTDTRSSIRSFTATPMADGAGGWRLSWEISGTASLDGLPAPAGAGMAVHPSERTTYTLTAGDDRETIVLAPVSAIELDNVVARVDQGVEDAEIGFTVLAAGSEAAPLQEVIWSSTDPEVAEVSAQGRLLAHAPGTVTITATSAQDNRITAAFDLEVLQPAPPQVLQFATTADPAALQAGDEIELTIETTGNGQVTVVEVVTNGVERGVTEVTNGTLAIVLPSDKAEVNYVLRARNSLGETAEQWLWDSRQPLPGWVCQDPEDEITFADAELERHVWSIYRNTDLDPGTGVLTCGIVQEPFFTPLPSEDDEYGLMEQHNSIVINRCDQDDDPTVTSLEGIQHLSTLLRLELMCNDITDISRLASLTSLQELNLDRNMVSDVSPLAALTDLRILGLYQNEVEDVTALAGLTELRVLYLSENRVKDVSALAGLVNLEHLWLYLNCDVVAPDHEFWSGCLDDITPLSELHSLRSLVFHLNEIDDISALTASMDSLELVFATGNRISEVNNLGTLPALTTARLDDNLISSVSGLAANTGFPGGAAPFYWERIDPGPPENRVAMPPIGSFAEHVSLHMNCLDTTDPRVQEDLNTLRANGALVSGDDVLQMRDACNAGISAMGAQPRAVPDLDGLLRSDSRWYGNR